MPGTWTHRQWTPLAQALGATGDSWTLLVVLALAPGHARLSHLEERLPGITRVLEQHVQHMVEFGLLSRRRFREMPPRVEIELSDCGRELVPIASALARWGCATTGRSRRRTSGVRADALVRQLPALLDEEAGLGVQQALRGARGRST